MNLREINQAFDHKIIDGSEFCWTCWPNARYLDYESEYAHASVIFSTKTQEVYSAEINDKEDKHRPYRWYNPEYRQQYIDESTARGVDHQQAWDNVKWCDLEIAEDFLEKASAIFSNQEFDTRVQVPIDLTDSELLELMTMAHKRDITFNQLITEILTLQIEKLKNETQS
jgi:hypothetical protein